MSIITFPRFTGAGRRFYFIFPFNAGLYGAPDDEYERKEGREGRYQVRERDGWMGVRGSETISGACLLDESLVLMPIFRAGR